MAGHWSVRHSNDGTLCVCVIGAMRQKQNGASAICWMASLARSYPKMKTSMRRKLPFKMRTMFMNENHRPQQAHTHTPHTTNNTRIKPNTTLYTKFVLLADAANKTMWSACTRLECDNAFSRRAEEKKWTGMSECVKNTNWIIFSLWRLSWHFRVWALWFYRRMEHRSLTHNVIPNARLGTNVAPTLANAVYWVIEMIVIKLPGTLNHCHSKTTNLLFFISFEFFQKANRY